MIASAKKDVEEGQDEDEDENRNDGNRISSAMGDSNTMPFNTRLLKRPTFQSNNMNEYAEPLVQGFSLLLLGAFAVKR